MRNKHAQFIPDQKNNEKKLTDQNEDASTSAQKEPPNKQRKMDQFVQKSKMELHPAEKIACRMIIRQNMSLKSIEDKDFVYVLKKAFPDYKVCNLYILMNLFGKPKYIRVVCANVLQILYFRQWFKMCSIPCSKVLSNTASQLRLMDGKSQHLLRHSLAKWSRIYDILYLFCICIYLPRGRRSEL